MRARQIAVAALLAATAAAPPTAALSPRTYFCFFDHGSSELSPACQNVAVELAEGWRRAYSSENRGRGGTASYQAVGLGIAVYGHADAAEAASGKASASKARAEAVAAFLRLNGVPQDAMEVRWFGASRPLVPTAKAVVEPQNRHVQFIWRWWDKPALPQSRTPP